MSVAGCPVQPRARGLRVHAYASVPAPVYSAYKSKAASPQPYAGPVQVNYCPGKGLTVVTTQHVTTGTLLLCCSPLAVLYGTPQQQPSNQDLTDSLAARRDLTPLDFAWLTMLPIADGSDPNFKQSTSAGSALRNQWKQPLAASELDVDLQAARTAIQVLLGRQDSNTGNSNDGSSWPLSSVLAVPPHLQAVRAAAQVLEGEAAAADCAVGEAAEWRLVGEAARALRAARAAPRPLASLLASTTLPGAAQPAPPAAGPRAQAVASLAAPAPHQGATHVAGPFAPPTDTHDAANPAASPPTSPGVAVNVSVTGHIPPTTFALAANTFPSPAGPTQLPGSDVAIQGVLGTGAALGATEGELSLNRLDPPSLPPLAPPLSTLVPRDIVAQLVQRCSYGEAMEDVALAELREDAPLSFAGVWPAYALLNHSCAPNTSQTMVEGSLIVHAARPILAGEEVTTCYLGEERFTHVAARRAALRAAHGFFCQCPRCRMEHEHFPTHRYRELDEAAAGPTRGSSPPGSRDTADPSKEVAGAEEGPVGAQASLSRYVFDGSAQDEEAAKDLMGQRGGWLQGLLDGVFGRGRFKTNAASKHNLLRFINEALPQLEEEVQDALTAARPEAAQKDTMQRMQELVLQVDAEAAALKLPMRSLLMLHASVLRLRCLMLTLDDHARVLPRNARRDLLAATTKAIEAAAPGSELHVFYAVRLATLRRGAGQGFGALGPSTQPPPGLSYDPSSGETARTGRDPGQGEAAADVGLSGSEEDNVEEAVLDRMLGVLCSQAHAARYGRLQGEVLEALIYSRRRLLMGTSLSQHMLTLAWRMDRSVR